MATKKTKGLGRGLDALLIPEPAAADPAGVPMLLPLEEISPGQYQPRTRMDEGALYELAESIRAQGIMQPILVRQLAQPRAVTLPAADGAGEETATAHYEIIAGERRYRAARLAGLPQVPVLVREVADEAAAAQRLQRQESLTSNKKILHNLTTPATRTHVNNAGKEEQEEHYAAYDVLAYYTINNQQTND